MEFPVDASVRNLPGSAPVIRTVACTEQSTVIIICIQKLSNLMFQLLPCQVKADIKVAPYSLIQFTNDLYRSVRLDVILATFAWNFRSSEKFLKQEPQILFLSAFMYQNMIILHYFLDFLKS